MKKYNLSQLNQISICPVLFNNDWAYSSKSELNDCYLFGIKEIFKWFYRRSNPMTPGSITTVLGQYALRSGKGIDNLSAEEGVRKFVSGSFYQQIDQPFYRYKIEMILNSETELNHVIPVMARRGKKVYLITFDKGGVSERDYMNMYETMFSALWAFHNLNELPVFLNLSLFDNEIQEQYFKTDMKYITKAEKRLIAIGRKMRYPSAIPSWEVCTHCERRSECPQE